MIYLEEFVSENASHPVLSFTDFGMFWGSNNNSIPDRGDQLDRARISKLWDLPAS